MALQNPPSVGTGVHFSGTDGLVLTPPSTTTGRLQLAFVACDGSGATEVTEITTSEWTRCFSKIASSVGLAVFVRVVATATATFTFGTGNSEHHYGVIVEYTGAWGNVLNPRTTVISSSGSSALPSPFIPYTLATSSVLRAIAIDRDTVTLVAPTSHTLLDNWSSDGANCVSFGLADADTLGNGAETAAWTGTYSDGCISCSVEVREDGTIALTGTVVAGGVLESEIVTGSETIIGTITGAENAPA